MNQQSSFELAEKIRISLEEQAFIGPFDRPAYITISIGLATYPDHAQTAESLLLTSDKALYESKKKGRNQTSQAK